MGNGMVLKNKEIIGIFDAKTIQASRENRKIIWEVKKIEKKKKEEELRCNSIILMDSMDEENQYEITQIAVSTLKKRLEKGIF